MITHLRKNYNSDRDNLIDWFSDKIDEQGLGWGMVTNLVYEINQTVGLMDTFSFYQDITSAGLEIEFINIFYVKPGIRSFLYNYKLRQKPWQPGEPLMDENLENRKCVLAIPVKNDSGYIQRISESIKINDDNMRDRFDVESNIKIDEMPFVMRGDFPVYVSNFKGTVPLYMVHVGFVGNPSYEEVVAKLG